MEKQASKVRDTLAIVDSFLRGVESQGALEKTAEESQMDKAENTPANQSKAKGGEGKTEQTNLGKELSQDAKDSGSTIDSTPANSDADDKKPVDDQGNKRLTVDDKVTEKGNIGPIRHQETTQEKTARAIRLGNAILQKIAEESEDKEKKEEHEAGESEDKEKKEEKEATDTFFDKCAEISAAAAADFFESHLSGMLKRASDEADLKNADFAKIGVDQATLARMGGIPGLLDKVADDNPMAVMPEGMVGDASGGPAPEAAPGPEAPAPAEGGEGGPGLDEVAQALSDAGVAPQDIDEAAQQVNELFQAGVSPEEAAQAINELMAEEGGGEGGEGGAAPEGGEIPEAPPVPEAPMEPTEKTAAERQRLETIKSYLRQ